MAVTRTFTNTDRHDIRKQMDAFFARLGQGFNAYLLRQSRFNQVESLNAKTDEELAAMGLTRERIVQYVFRDVFYL